ncbi:FIGNL1-interacting regulator of recombination and mitosis isoform 2-T2 [Anomaloglossus baeobatrachus]|uniref:FIGNL1-interacting regulator of recombination and mitosis isoform X2 n=1 Tax=Anomaloglossus baeobatrachus TaxID=238106 RepID=UPI003F4F50C3
MSQADLEEMGGWSPETCQRELPAALPQLYSRFQCSDNWNEKIRLFKIVTGMFMPHIRVLELEQDVFLKLLPQVVEHFHNLLSEISSHASKLSSQNTEVKNTLRNILQDMSQWIEALTACVRYVCSIEEPVPFEYIQSLPSSVLQVLTDTFTHCKDSDSVYCGRLHLVSDLLQALFKEAVSLEKQLMELLDKTTITASASVGEITGMVSVVHTFLDICAIVSKMDHAVHANTWKFIIKQTVKHHTLIKNQLRHDEIVSSLCDDILLSFKSCLHLAEHMKLTGTQEMTDQRLFQKTVKLCRFFANSLVHYSKEFIQYLAGSCICFHKMYLQIHSLFPPSLSAVPMSDIHKNELSSVFLGVLEALLVQLLPFRPFMELVLSECQDLLPDHHLPYCLILTNILNKLPTLPDELQMLWCTSSKSPARLSIFQALFQSFARCYPEIALPAVLQDELEKGLNQINITFYQYVCTHLCACIVLLPPGCFAELERSLLCAVLSDRMLESLLAIDVWCFLARYGTAELCAHHVNIIAFLVKSSPSHSDQLAHLTLLLRRLLFLMDADNQVEFIKRFPPAQEENVSLWQHVSLSSLPSALRLQVESGLFTAALSQCRKSLRSKFTLEDIQQLNVSLSVMLTACHSYERNLNSQQQCDVMAIIFQLGSLLSVKQIAGQPSLLETICRYLDLFSCIITKAEAPLLTQVVSLISSLCQEESPSHVKLAVLDFLLLLGRIIIPQEIQVAILSKVAVLFSMLLADKTWIVKQYALETFTQFAEETSYEEIVPQSLTSEDTKNYVVYFLNKSILFTEEDNNRLQRLKDEKQVLETFFIKTKKKHIDVPVLLEPSAKRPRQATFADEEFETHVKAAESSLFSIQSLLQENPIPQWLPEKLCNIKSLLTRIQTTAEKNLILYRTSSFTAT